MMVSWEILISVILIIFLSHVVQTVTGFAGSMLAIPFLTLVISLTDAKILITVIGIIWSVWILATDHKYIDWKFLVFSVSIMTLGIIVGTFLVKVISSQGLMIVMGSLIIISAIRNLMTNEKKNEHNLIRDVVFGFTAGIMQGMVLMGGPLLVVLTNAHFEDRRYYRATLAALWIVVDIILMFIFRFNNQLNFKEGLLVLVSIIPLILSIIIGNQLNAHIKSVGFNKIVNGLLIFSGLTILLQAVS